MSASGPASPVLRWFGGRVGGLGPGLTSQHFLQSGAAE